jgi:cation diffusion facilitator family transporter
MHDSSGVTDHKPTHSHVFEDSKPKAERKTRWALILTAIMMVAEIIGGWTFGSMALLADGWHMSSHVLALGLALAAYVAARRWAHDPRFNFGTWKIEVLAGYTSALMLVGIAALMVYESVVRLLSPTVVSYPEAIVVAVVGLGVNVLCAWILKDDHHGHSHSHSHDHSHGHQTAAKATVGKDSLPHQDLNLRSAYVHVLADAATSVLAIVALCAGQYAGVLWLDPVMGIVGAILVTVWAMGLLGETSRVLVDAERDAPIASAIHQTIATHWPHAQLDDLHVWRVGKGLYACVLTITCHEPLTATQVKQALDAHAELAHVTVEINQPVLASSG